jgi:chromosome partitioning protein
MKTIVLAGAKGGGGKTTLALNLAIEAAKTDSVAVFDSDPQQSLRTFFGIRGGENPALLRNVGSLRRVSADLKKAGAPYAYLIADSPGSFMKVIRDAISAADCVVVPLRPSPLDILAQEDLRPVLRELGKMPVTVPVITMIDARTSHTDFVERISEMFTRPPVLIRNRFAYARAMIGGRAGFEIDKECTAEILALWQTVKHVLKEEDAGE